MKIEPVTSLKNNDSNRRPIRAATLEGMGIKVSMTRGSGLRAEMVIDGRQAKVEATSGSLEAPVLATFKDGSSVHLWEVVTVESTPVAPV